MITRMRHSLWFKLAGAFVAVVAVTLLLAATLLLVTERELSEFAGATAQAVQRLLEEGGRQAPTAAPVEAILVEETVDDSGAVVDQTTRVLAAEEIQAATATEGALFLANVRRAAVVAVVLAGLPAILAATWLFRMLTRPLAELRTAAESVAAGNLSVRVASDRHDEVGDVARAFNQMANELERQERRQRQLVADVAHELRTPLSAVRANVEAMIDGLLAPEPAELRELNEEVIRLTPLAQLHTVSLVAEGGPEVGLVYGDRDKLLQALVNLVDNAIRHSPPGGRVVVAATRGDSGLHIGVSDEGPGIPAEAIPSLFDRFWRGDPSRSRRSGGSGLGLAIGQQIVLAHGGRVTVDSPAAGGSRFTITLPLAPPVSQES